jgi:hypothetical protein
MGGGIGDMIFGTPAGSNQSSNSSSSSGNYAWPAISGSMGPALNYTTAGGNMIASLLGIPGYGTAGTGAPYTAPTPTGPGNGGHMVDLFHDGINGNGRAAQRAGQPTQYWVPGTGGNTPTPTPATGGTGTGTGTPTTPTTPATGTPGTAGSALDSYANSGGMNFLMQNMQKAVTSSKAAQGLLQSGSYGTALQDRGYGLASTYLNQYLNHLMDFSKLGLGAAGAMSNAGQWSQAQSQSTGSSTKGKDGLLGTVLGAVPFIGRGGSAGSASDGAGAAASDGDVGLALSDRRLKKNIEHVHTLPDGLRVYEYEMVYEPGDRIRGVMADEVKELRPWAYVPNMIPGYDGVDYGKIGNLDARTA